MSTIFKKVLYGCKLCAKYEKKLASMRNFNFSWCRGTTNVKLDAVKTHMNGKPHKYVCIEVSAGGDV